MQSGVEPEQVVQLSPQWSAVSQVRHEPASHHIPDAAQSASTAQSAHTPAEQVCPPAEQSTQESPQWSGVVQSAHMPSSQNRAAPQSGSVVHSRQTPLAQPCGQSTSLAS